MNILPFELAKKIYTEEFWLGRNKYNKLQIGFSIFPYNILYNNESFIEIEIKLSDIVLTGELSNEVVNKYIDIIKKTGMMSNIWLTIGKNMKNGDTICHYHSKFEASDGNHRVKAYNALGYEKVKGYIPLSHYNFGKKAKQWQIE